MHTQAIKTKFSLNTCTHVFNEYIKYNGEYINEYNEFLFCFISLS